VRCDWKCSVGETPLTERSLLRDLDFFDIGQQLAVHRAVDGLQRTRVVIHVRDDVHGRGLPPIGQDAALLMYQRLPFFFQVPWPKPPSESKTQERICLVTGSSR